jgi:hypothetical protein
MRSSKPTALLALRSYSRLKVPLTLQIDRSSSAYVETRAGKEKGKKK